MRNKIVLLGLICIIAFILRFYKLGEIPNGLQRDETSLGYNAYSILLTARDEHGVFLPQNFKAFGEYKLPGYIYTLVPFIQVFGLTPFSVRLPSALFGICTVLLMYFLVKELFSSRNYELGTTNLPIIASLLLALNPWHIHFSRGAFEVTLALFFLTAGTYLFLVGIRKQPLIIVLSLISFALSAYTYNISRLFVPLFLLYILFTFRNQFLSLTKPIKLLLAITGILSFLPLVIGLLSQGGLSSTSGTFIFSSSAIQAPLLEYRSYLVSLPVFFVKLFFNSYILTMWHYLTNIVSYASVQFFFITGSLHGNHGIGTIGQWYLWEFIPIILGLLMLIRYKTQKAESLLLVWIVLTVGIASLTREAPQATRSFFLIIPITICSGIGITWIIEHMKPHTNVSKIIASIGILFIAYNFVYYLTTYYVQFPVSYAKAWSSEDFLLSTYIQTHDKEYKSIIFDKNAGFTYTSFLFYTKYPPRDFQKAQWSTYDSEGFSFPVQFGKYEYKTIDWDLDMKRPNTLIITKAETLRTGITPIATFSFPTRPVVIALGQEILQYPVTENAYALVGTQ